MPEDLTLYDALIRADFVFATALLVVAPLLLLAASFDVEPVRTRLLVYWRTSSLFLITVYLLAAEVELGFFAGYAARALVPLAMWRGDAFAPLRGRTLPRHLGWLGTAFRKWSTFVVAYNLLGLVYMLPLLYCAFGSDASTMCQAWYGPPQEFVRALHPDAEMAQLRRYAGLGVGVYASYILASSIALRQAKQRGA
jgi:hypothetical protein